MTFHEFQQWTGKHGPCGCGDPDIVYDLIRDVLELLKNRFNKDVYPDYESFHKKELEILPHEPTMWFMYYWLDNIGLSEHGGCVPGWLTKQGEELLEAFDLYLEDLKHFIGYSHNNVTGEYDIPEFEDDYIPSFEK